MVYVAPSILSADFGNLAADIEMINRSEADIIHCDVMDGNFVPNISFGFPILHAVNAVATKPLDVHLMIQNPELYIEDFKKAGAHFLTVHQEACVHLDRTLSQIREAGMKAGVALNPSTPPEVLRDVIHLADMVCLMSVNPGFGGQKFIENTYSKIRRTAALREAAGTQTLIEIDGGVNGANAGKLLAAGADVLVAGSFVFKSDNPTKVISLLKGSETVSKA